MNLKEYFETKTGTGVLSTADSDGTVNTAIYSKPHVVEDGSVAFIMRERLTYSNLQSTDSAAYLFIESGGGYSGTRLLLKKTEESVDEALIKKMTRRSLSEKEDKDKGPKHLVYFRVEKTLPLIGAGEE
nr:pyridoxamine 5'-phosphate oxidase family protein [Desulfobulbaceae bacterium]